MITPKAGYIVDPNNPNGVIPDPGVQHDAFGSPEVAPGTPIPAANPPTDAVDPKLRDMSIALANGDKTGGLGSSPVTVDTKMPDTHITTDTKGPLSEDDKKLMGLGLTQADLDKLKNPNGFDPQSFNTLIGNIENKLKTNNDLVTTRGYIIKHLYDSPLTPDEMAKLPPEIQEVIKSGNKDAIEIQLRLMNDQISGRANTLTQSISTLTSGYEKAVATADKQKSDAMGTIKDFIAQYGSKAIPTLQALYPNIDLSKLMNIPTLAETKPKIVGSASGGYFQINPDGTSTQVVAPSGGAGGADSSVLAGMLNYYYTTGQVPAMGNSSSGLRAAFWGAVGSGDPNAVGGAAANKAAISAATAAGRTQANQYAAATTAIGTMEKQLQLLDTYSDKVDRTGTPILNKYLLAAKGQIAGDADTVALQNIVQTASYEFAKILSGSAASIAGVSVTSAEDAKNLINANMTPKQIKEIIGLMKTEANYRLTTQKATIDSIQQDIKNLGNSGGTSDGGNTTDPMGLGL